MFPHLYQMLLAGQSGQVPQEDQKQGPPPVVVPAHGPVAGQKDLEIGGWSAGTG
jgi:hypothetical protein